MHKTLFIAAISGFLVVMLGAFGAHALETRILPEMLEVWNTSVQYHMFHTAALIGLALLQREHPAPAGLNIVSYLFIAGLVLFCGSLYVLALTGARWLGMITPLGGLLFLAAWLQMALVCFRYFRSSNE
jgi:uncharacterized membrane protein YgdD (TMEM256/DUF423 family)